jgi:glycosyltransferase involved in cell wall biosynthesis
MDLSVCLIATELYAWGRHGGFGKCTRTIGRALVERGVDVSVVVPRGDGQKPVEELDGMKVRGFPLYRYPFTGSIYGRYDYDVYHSEEPSWGSALALDMMPGRKHMVTCQNPRTAEDWQMVDRFYPMRRKLYNFLLGGTLKEAVGRMDAVYCQARHAIPKARAIYQLEADPGFLPNPVEIPKDRTEKANEPTVCFLGRFDGEKRPEQFFELARRFPDVRFIAMGRAHDEERDRRLRSLYGGIPNLALPGFLEGRVKNRLLEESWILVNTSVSEGLPVSFLEAAAHGCAILSFHDPDGFASDFGRHVTDGDLDRGLAFLIEDDRWRDRGEKGYEYVSDVHEKKRVTDLHIEAYEDLLAG